MRTMMMGAALIAAALQQSGGDTALTPGTVSIETVDAQPPQPALEGVFAQAVGEALTDAQFLILPGQGHGRYIARVAVSQQARGTVASRGKNGGPVVGGGVASVSLGRTSQFSGLVVTRLDVSLVERSDGHVAWSGSASTAQVTGTPAGATPAVAAKLAKAVIGRFPQRMDEPIAVP